MFCLNGVSKATFEIAQWHGNWSYKTWVETAKFPSIWHTQLNEELVICWLFNCSKSPKACNATAWVKWHSWYASMWHTFNFTCHAYLRLPLWNVAGPYFSGDVTLFCWSICFNFKSQLAFEIRGKTLAKLFKWYTLTGDWFLPSHNAKHHCYHHLFYVQEIKYFF